MFSNLIDKFRPVFYVQIWEQRIRAINLVNGEVFDDKPLLAVYRRHGEKILSALLVRDASGRAESAAVTNPFSHPRTLLADFSAAEKLLQLILQEKLGGNRRQLIRPRLIIQPMEKLQGGLTPVEKRAYRELGLSAGASRPVIHTGKAIKPTLEACREILANHDDTL